MFDMYMIRMWKAKHFIWKATKELSGKHGT